MDTATMALCRDDRTHMWLIQTTATDGEILELCVLDGEVFQPASWSFVADLGEREDPDDSDEFWMAVARAILYIAEHYGRDEGRDAFITAYGHVLSPRDLVREFEELLPPPQGETL